MHVISMFYEMIQADTIPYHRALRQLKTLLPIKKNMV